MTMTTQETKDQMIERTNRPLMRENDFGAVAADLKDRDLT
jgi:hypothetical protein